MHPLVSFRSRRVWLVAGLALVLCGGCARRLQAPPVGAETVDPTFSLTSHIEDGLLLSLIVGTRPALRSKGNYVPFEFALVNKALGKLDLTLESFYLVDDQGQRYGAVGQKELSRNYDGNQDHDRRLTELPPVMRLRYRNYNETVSALTPKFGQAPNPELSLRRQSWTSDLLYFPRPEGGVRGRTFELFVKSPDLEQEAFVRFTVKGE